MAKSEKSEKKAEGAKKPKAKAKTEKKAEKKTPPQKAAGGFKRGYGVPLKINKETGARVLRCYVGMHLWERPAGARGPNPNTCAECRIGHGTEFILNKIDMNMKLQRAKDREKAQAKKEKAVSTNGADSEEQRAGATS